MNLEMIPLWHNSTDKQTTVTWNFKVRLEKPCYLKIFNPGNVSFPMRASLNFNLHKIVNVSKLSPCHRKLSSKQNQWKKQTNKKKHWLFSSTVFICTQWDKFFLESSVELSRTYKYIHKKRNHILSFGEEK